MKTNPKIDALLEVAELHQQIIDSLQQDFADIQTKLDEVIQSVNAMNASKMLSWTCEICEQKYPDSEIHVTQHDFSVEHDLPFGSVIRNVRHCRRPSCVREARQRDRWNWRKP